MKGSVNKVKLKTCHRWEAVVDVPTGEGRRKQRRRRFKTKRAANAWLAQINHQVNQGHYFEPSEQTLSDYLSNWLDDHGRENLRASTLSTYEGLIRNHIDPTLGHIPVSKLSPQQIQSFYSNKRRNGRQDGKTGGLSSATVRQMHAILHKALDDAVRLRIIQDNPASKAQAPAVRHQEMKYLNMEQVRELLSAAEEDRLYFPVYHLAVMTGLRRGEILGLRWDDIDFSTRTAQIRRSLVTTYNGQTVMEKPKTSAGLRTVSLPSTVSRLLRKHKAHQAENRLQLDADWLNNENLVCTTADGRSVDPSNLHHNFKRILNHAGLPNVRFHDLRHTHATLMLAQGEKVEVVSKRLGHNSIHITLDTYRHVMPNEDRDAADRLDRALFGSHQ